MPAVYEVYQALGDPTRLAMIERLGQRGEMTTLDLVGGLGMSRQAATKHLAVLESVGLVKSRAVGRKVVRRLEAGALQDAHSWLAARARLWDRKLQALADFVEAPETPPE